MVFSVVIPVYNVAPYLKACLDSIGAAANRVTDSVEVICIDDGSTDASGEILDAYATTSAQRPANLNLRVIRQTNAGVSAARNHALEIISGDWFLFVDADDFVRETWLEDVVAMIERHPDADLLSFGKLPYYGKGEWGEDAVDEVDVGIAEKIDDVLAGCCVYQFAYSARRFKDLRFLPLSVGEDLVFVAEVLARARKCFLSQRREYGYRYREGSASHVEITPAKMRDVISFNCAMFATLSGSGKRIGASFTQGRGNEWFSTLPRIILSHRHDSEWRKVLEFWFDSMRNFSELTCFSRGMRRHAQKIACARTRLAVVWHCLLPSWLKRKKII